MEAADLLSLIAGSEGQQLEFKKSLAEEREAIQSLVAFANSTGGKVLIGVDDDGKVLGADIGQNSRENLANRIKSHTYPSLPAIVDCVNVHGMQVLVAEVPRDVPPIVGVYLYSSQAIEPDRVIKCSDLQAFRRVGRTNQREDFMRMRAALPSDPLLRVTVPRFTSGKDGRFFIQCQVWMEDDSGAAHDIVPQTGDPNCNASKTLPDLPYPQIQQTEIPGARGYPYKTEKTICNQAHFELTCATQPDTYIIVRVSYADDWGLRWESCRRIDLGEATTAPSFTRRIIALPPKDNAT